MATFRLGHRTVDGPLLAALLALASASPGVLADVTRDRLGEAFSTPLAPKWWTPGPFEDSRLLDIPIRWDRCVDRSGKTWPLDVSFAALPEPVTIGVEALLPYLRDRDWDQHIEQIRGPQALVSPERARAFARGFPAGNEVWLGLVPYVEIAGRRYWLVPASATRSFGFDGYFPDCDGGMAKTARVPGHVHYYPGLSLRAGSPAAASAVVRALVAAADDTLEPVEPARLPASELAGLARLGGLLVRVLSDAVAANRWPAFEHLLPPGVQVAPGFAVVPGR